MSFDATQIQPVVASLKGYFKEFGLDAQVSFPGSNTATPVRHPRCSAAEPP